MSNRFKKIKRKKKRDKMEIGKADSKPVSVQTGAGTFIGQQRSDSGWMTLEGFSMNPGQGSLDQAVQQSACEVSGEVFVKPITGHYKDQPEETLRQMVAEIKEVFDSFGVPAVVSPGMPLWLQAEFLSNLLDFEMQPPCGCPSGLKSVASKS
jgi:2'-5' RNA ligase